MFASLKSEYRKLFTTRSFYITIGILSLFMIFFAFYAQGYRALAGTDSSVLQGAIINGTSIVGAIGGILGILMVTHEYRHNTIMYTLTASNSRTKTLLSKVLVATSISLALTAFFGIVIVLLIHLGMNLGHFTLQPQTIYFKDIIWQCLFSSWGSMMFAFLLSIFIRNQVGAVTAYFLIPTTIEGLLSILLRENSNYLPYRIVGAVSSHIEGISPVKALGVSLIYILGGLIIAFITFNRRDAQ